MHKLTSELKTYLYANRKIGSEEYTYYQIIEEIVNNKKTFTKKATDRFDIRELDDTPNELFGLLLESCGKYEPLDLLNKLSYILSTSNINSEDLVALTKNYIDTIKGIYLDKQLQEQGIEPHPMIISSSLQGFKIDPQQFYQSKPTEGITYPEEMPEEIQKFNEMINNQAFEEG